MAEMKQTPSWVDVIRAERLRQNTRNPGWAALMSFFVMGLGQVYAGHIDRGLTLLIVQIVSFLTGYSLYAKGMVYEQLAGYLGPAGIVLIVYILLVFLIVLWVYNVKDAYYLALFADFRDWTEIEKVIGRFLGEGQPRLLGQSEMFAGNGPELTEPHSGSQSEPVFTVSPVRPALAKIIVDDEELEIPAAPASNSRKSFAKGRKHKGRPLTEEKLEELVETERLWRFPARATGGVVVFLLILGGGCYLWYQTRYEIQNQPRSAFSVTADWDRIQKAALATLPQVLSHDQVGTTSVADPIQPPSIPASWYDHALALLQSGDKAGGLAKLEEGLAKNSAPIEVWKSYLAASHEQGTPEAYEVALASFLELYPREADFWIILAKCQLDRKEHVAASRSLLKALEVVPEHPRANFWLGVIYRELNLPDDAVTPLLKAVAADPLNSEFNRELGLTYLDQFDRVKARRYLQKALSVEPGSDELKTLLLQMDRMEIAATIDNRSNLAMVRAEPPSVTLPNPAAGAPAPPSLVSQPEPARVDGRGGLLLYEAPVDSISRVASVPTPAVIDSSSLNVRVKVPEVTSLASLPQAVLTKPAVASVTKSVSHLASAGTPIVSQSPTKTADVEANPIIRPSTGDGASPDSVSDPEDLPPEALVMTKTKQPDGRNLARRIPAGDTSLTISGPSVLFDSDNGKVQKVIQEKGTRKPAVSVEADDELLANSMAQDDSIAENASGGNSVEAGEVVLKKALETGLSQYYRGNWEESLPPFLEYLKKKPSGEIYDLVGNVFSKLKMSDDAFAASEKAYQLGFRPATTLIRLGTLAESMKRYDAGAGYLKEALEKIPHRMDVKLSYAACLRGLGEFGEAESVYMNLLAGPKLSPALKSRVQREMTILKKMAPGRR